MSFSRREFMQVLAVASAGGMALDHKDVLAGKPSLDPVHWRGVTPPLNSPSFREVSEAGRSTSTQ